MDNVQGFVQLDYEIRADNLDNGADKLKDGHEMGVEYGVEQVLKELELAVEEG